MSFYAGIDYSTRAIDVVLVDEDTGQATWYRLDLGNALGSDAFERTRNVRDAMRTLAPGHVWDDVVALAIEEPRGPGNGSLLRIQGAILACLPRSLLVQPYTPNEWRAKVGLSGRASKETVGEFAKARLGIGPHDVFSHYSVDRFPWPQDAFDAYCLALAVQAHTRHGAPA